MMKRISLVVAGAILALVTTAALFGQSSTSSGGAFVPGDNYVVGGTWTWKGASPLLFEGATNDSVKTTLTVTDPTANRTWTLPDATDQVVGRATTDTLTNKTLTAPVVATVTNTGTLTLPVNTGGVPVNFDCASTGTGNQTCAPTAAATSTHVYSGRSTLSSNAATITFPIAYTATTSFECISNDVTTRANPVQMVPASTTTATITNTTGASDVIQWICAGQ